MGKLFSEASLFLMLTAMLLSFFGYCHIYPSVFRVYAVIYGGQESLNSHGEAGHDCYGKKF
jgi:hypothetical protein